MVFINTIGKRIDSVISGERTCICAYDGFGYYAYLPHLIQKGNLDITTEWANKVQRETCGDAPVYQFANYKKENHVIDIYHMGLSFIQAPSFFVGHLITIITGHPIDGFSKPYHIAYLTNVLLFIFLGLLYVRKIALLYFNDKITAAILLFIYLGTNVFVTMGHQYDLTHLYLFTLNAIWIYHILKYRAIQSTKTLVYAAIIFGLTIAVRPTQAMFGIIPFFILLNIHRNIRFFWKRLLLFPAMAFFFNIPQFIYWKLYGGSWFIPNLHTEDLILTDPNLYKFLFSFRKGWLIYTPIFILLIPGFIYFFKKYKNLSILFLGTLISYIYIMSSWECWWYASSISQRVMVDIYPLLIIPFGFALTFHKKVIRYLIFVFAILTSALSIFQNIQFERGLLNTSHMTWSHYKYIFGKLNIPDYHSRFLRIDQYNTEWPKDLQLHPSNEYTLEETNLFELDSPIQSNNQEYVDIERIPIYQMLPSDESLITVDLTINTMDSTKSIILYMKTAGKHNSYGWDSFEISLNSNNQSNTAHQFKFNIPDMRHNNDEIQMYLHCPEPVDFKLTKFKVSSLSVVR